MRNPNTPELNLEQIELLAVNEFHWIELWQLTNLSVNTNNANHECIWALNELSSEDA